MAGRVSDDQEHRQGPVAGQTGSKQPVDFRPRGLMDLGDVTRRSELGFLPAQDVLPESEQADTSALRGPAVGKGFRLRHLETMNGSQIRLFSLSDLEMRAL